MIAPVPGWLYDWARNRKPKVDRIRTEPDRIAKPVPPHILARARLRRLADGALAGIGLDQPELADIAAALALIPNPDYGWDDWNRVGMAIWASVDGDPIGCEMFDRWSRKSRKYEEGAAQERWTKYAGSPPTELSFGTLVYMAREVNPDFRAINGSHALPPQLAQASPSNPLIELNEKYSVIGDIGSKCMVLSWINSKVDKLVKVPSFQSFKSFGERYANQYIRVAGDTKQLGSYWLKWTGRKSYEGIDLVPNGGELLPGNVLNLWRGFAVEPIEGNWDLMKWHICHTLARENADLARYIVRWAAWAVQHPGEPAEVALVLKGGKGTGKSTFGNAMRRLFGQHGMQVYSGRHLTGNFNAHLRSCLLLFADEAFWAGDKQGESTLKALLTEGTIVIEQKGVDATAWINRLHIIMAANADWVVPASHDERRFQVVELDDEKKNYFQDLHRQMKEGGLEAMLFDLLRVDLTDWHPRQIIHNEALRDQKIQSMEDKAAWWEAVLQEGKLPFRDAQKPNVAPAWNLLDNARHYTSNTSRPITATSLGRYLTKLNCFRIHTDLGAMWVFPPLNKARSDWEKHMHGWKWDQEIAEWRVK